MTTPADFPYPEFFDPEYVRAEVRRIHEYRASHLYDAVIQAEDRVLFAVLDIIAQSLSPDPAALARELLGLRDLHFKPWKSASPSPSTSAPPSGWRPP